VRLSLFILGVFAAVVCIEKPAKAAQNYPWCAYYNTTGATVIRGAGSQRSNNAWPMCSPLAERVDLLPTRPRREYRRDAPAVTLSNDYGLCKSSGSLAMFAAILRGSSAQAGNKA
jgi:hypothetical protein